MNDSSAHGRGSSAIPMQHEINDPEGGNNLMYTCYTGGPGASYRSQYGDKPFRSVFTYSTPLENLAITCMLG